ncbi:hypothetical protein HAV15_012167 [Penicillium sp. str. |nr:hypothetical protein HAV15_012167 [Penicillium sp. str. \
MYNVPKHRSPGYARNTRHRSALYFTFQTLPRVFVGTEAMSRVWQIRLDIHLGRAEHGLAIIGHWPSILKRPVDSS